MIETFDLSDEIRSLAPLAKCLIYTGSDTECVEISSLAIGLCDGMVLSCSDLLFTGDPLHRLALPGSVVSLSLTSVAEGLGCAPDFNLVRRIVPLCVKQVQEQGRAMRAERDELQQGAPEAATSAIAASAPIDSLQSLEEEMAQAEVMQRMRFQKR
ncbi:MAG TPA: hypothetical protein VMV98_09350 [Acidobacteriaceae bacterium]|nr:hypothetical protein [Acidobacteriaceae bacterium]